MNAKYMIFIYFAQVSSNFIVPLTSSSLVWFIGIRVGMVLQNFRAQEKDFISTLPTQCCQMSNCHATQHVG
jgi:hypothetical protein